MLQNIYVIEFSIFAMKDMCESEVQTLHKLSQTANITLM